MLTYRRSFYVFPSEESERCLRIVLGLPGRGWPQKQASPQIVQHSTSMMHTFCSNILHALDSFDVACSLFNAVWLKYGVCSVIMFFHFPFHAAMGA